MITKEQAMSECSFEHVTDKNFDKTPLRCRASGNCKTWKRDLKRFSLPVKYGFSTHFHIDNTNAHEWTVAE